MRCLEWKTLGRRSLPEPLGLEPGHSGLQANQNLTQVSRKPLRCFFDDSVAPRSSDDGVPVLPARFPVYVSILADAGWCVAITQSQGMVSKFDRGLADTRQPWCVGSVAPLKGCNSACVPSARHSFAGEQWFM